MFGEPIKDTSTRRYAEKGLTRPDSLEPGEIRQICRLLIDLLDDENEIILQSRVPPH